MSGPRCTARAPTSISSPVARIWRPCGSTACASSARAVTSPHGPHATDDPAEIGPVDYRLPGPEGQLVRGVRAADPAAAARGAPRCRRPERHPLVVLPRHGGPYDGRRVEQRGPGRRGQCGARRPNAPSAASSTRPPSSRHRASYATWKAPGSPSGSRTARVSRRCLDFSEAMRAGGLKCPVEPDLRNDIWIKLLGNISFNPISALARATMRADLPARRHPRASSRSMMSETLAVAAALGCRPDISVERRLAGAERVGDHRTSTLQDLETRQTARTRRAARGRRRARRDSPGARYRRCAPCTPSRICSPTA